MVRSSKSSLKSKRSCKSNQFGRQPSMSNSSEDRQSSPQYKSHNFRDIDAASTTMSPLTSSTSKRKQSRKRKHNRPDIKELLSGTSIKSSLSNDSIGSTITETDPGEHYEKWKERDMYDSDETYLSSIGSKYTSRKKRRI